MIDELDDNNKDREENVNFTSRTEENGNQLSKPYDAYFSDLGNVIISINDRVSQSLDHNSDFPFLCHCGT